MLQTVTYTFITLMDILKYFFQFTIFDLLRRSMIMHFQLYIALMSYLWLTFISYKRDFIYRI